MLSGKTNTGITSATPAGSYAVLYSVYGYDPETGKAVTRTVKEMETKGYLHKFASKEEGRVTYISITDEGRRLSQKYDRDYFSELAFCLSDISEEDADCMIRTIEKFYQIMCERRKEYDKR